MRVLLRATPTSRPEIEKRLRQIAGLDLVCASNDAEVIAALPEADALALQVFFYTPEVARAVRETAKKLKLIQLLTVGYDRLANEKLPPGVVLATAGDSISLVVAEHAISLALALYRRIPEALALQAQDKWETPGIMSRMRSLDGKTVSIVGYGAIGKQIGRIARAFGAHVAGLSRSAKPSEHADEVLLIAQLDAVLARSDVVVVAAPLTDETRNLLSRERIAKIKPGAILINIARGAVVDSDALADALKSGHLAGAGLDVTEPEPPPAGHALWGAPNLIMTPHVAVAGGSFRLAQFTGANIERFMRDEPPLSVIKL